VLLTAVLVLFAMGVTLTKAPQSEVVMAWGLAGFVLCGTLSMLYRIVRPQHFTLSVSPTQLAWSTPSQSDVIPIEDVLRITITNGEDSSRVEVAVRANAIVAVPQNCLGNLDKLCVCLRAAFPNIEVVYYGPSWPRISRV
jgi:hypothetical protein